jgi:hypothetical protein
MTASVTPIRSPEPADTTGDQSYALWFGNALEAVRDGAESAATGLSLSLADEGSALILAARS